MRVGTRRSGNWVHSDYIGGSDRRTRIRFWLLAGVFLVLVLATFFAWRRYGNNVWRQVYPFSYRALITRHAEANGLDPLLVAAVIKAESNFWTWAVSRKNARGLMQLTIPTGRWVAGQIGMAGFEEQTLHDPESNITLGTWYLSHLLAEYRGDLPIALAAWNGGRGNVDGWLQNGRWSGRLDDISQIPFAETRAFVPRVLSNLAWYNKLYGDGGGK
jgi:soluble lytic murein transglycosylase